MEMLVFYLVAIALSAYETNKDKTVCKQEKNDTYDLRNWCQYEKDISYNER